MAETLRLCKADEKPDIRSKTRQQKAVVTKKLLEHWRDKEQRDLPFYFAQLEAIETLIWWVEAHTSYKQGIILEDDGGVWERVCSKMATGTGKTTVMAMIIAWQTLNAASYPKDKRFSNAIFIVTSGLTVKERLNVLYPSHSQNYYDTFDILPESLREKIRSVKIKIENWHSLMPLKESQNGVVKKGKESDEAFCRRVLGELANEKNIIIINDEAHHAYRIPAELKNKKVEGLSKEEQEEAMRWIEGLIGLKKEELLCEAVNTKGGFGKWRFAVSFSVNDVRDILNNISTKI